MYAYIGEYSYEVRWIFLALCHSCTIYGSSMSYLARTYIS